MTANDRYIKKTQEHFVNRSVAVHSLSVCKLIGFKCPFKVYSMDDTAGADTTWPVNLAQCLQKNGSGWYLSTYSMNPSWAGTKACEDNQNCNRTVNFPCVPVQLSDAYRRRPRICRICHHGDNRKTCNLGSHSDDHHMNMHQILACFSFP